MVLILNDLVSNGARREVSRDEAKAFAEQNGLFFVETSARTGVNVEEVFNMVTQEVCMNETTPKPYQIPYLIIPICTFDRFMRGYKVVNTKSKKAGMALNHQHYSGDRIVWISI